MTRANPHFSRQARSRMSVKKTACLTYNYHAAHEVESSQTSFMISSPIFLSRNSAMTPGIRDEIKDVPQDGSNDVPLELVVLDEHYR